MKMTFRKAFNLLEVLVALAIFGLAAGVLAQACANALNALDAVRNDSTDEPFIRFALRTALAIEDRDELENGGDISLPDNRVLTWTATVEETSVLDLFQVRLSLELAPGLAVFGAAAAAPRTESLYVLRPQWSDPVDRSALIQEKREALSASRPFR